MIAHLDPDVDWPNAWEGGRLHGHDDVREYWTRQFAAIDGRVEPTAIVEDGDDRIAVTVHQTVRDLDGQLQDDGTVTHAYTIRDGRIVQMEASSRLGRTRRPAPAAGPAAQRGAGLLARAGVAVQRAALDGLVDQLTRRWCSASARSSSPAATAASRRRK